MDFTVKSLTASANGVEFILGETVTIAGRTDPNVPVNVKIIDANDNVTFNITVNADAAGVYRVEYMVKHEITIGWYKAQVTSGDKSATVLFKVSDDKQLSAKSESGALTIRVANSTYGRGDYISVSGEAPPREKVTLTVTPPSGNESTAIVSADKDGKYQKLFQLALDASAGEWTIAANHNGDIAILKIRVL